MRRTITAGMVAVMAAMAMALGASAEKRALGHEDFDQWKSVTNYGLSRNGEWAAYAVNPQAGDGELLFRNTRNGREVRIPRGYRPTFTADSRWCLALVKPEYAMTRKAKINKKKDFDMPSDTLVYVDLTTRKIVKVANVKDFKVGKDGGTWVAWSSCDTAYIKPARLKDKDVKLPVVLRDMPSGAEKVVKNVKDWSFSRDGSKLAVTLAKEKKDSMSTSGVGVIYLPEKSLVLVDRDKSFYGAPVMSYDGNHLAYSCSQDTLDSGSKAAQVYVCDLREPMRSSREVPLLFKDAEGNPLRPNQYTSLEFSHNGKRLIAGVAPVIAPDDTTIYDFETGKLDIWRWDSPMTPPKEKSLLDKIRKVSMPVSVDLSNWKTTLLSDKLLEDVIPGDRWDADWALVLDPSQTMRSEQWNYYAPTPMYIVNLNSGERRKVGEYALEERPHISPEGRYVAWFRDRKWNVYDIRTGKTVDVGAAVPEELWDTIDEHPGPSQTWGYAGWSKGDERMLVYGKHDIWSLDPRGEKAPENLTKGAGAARNVRIRYLNLDSERRSVAPGDLMVLELFDYKDKYQGLGWTRYGKPAEPHLAVLDGHSYRRVRQARDAQVFTWQRGNFSEIPEIWVSNNTDFVKARQLTSVNDQLKDYRWGTAQLVRWHTYDGRPSEGVLYVPEDLDTSKKYPMLCVFYETGSEDLYTHYTMEPSWSWVNYPFYVSRGYVVFVPDIHYTSGRPGEDAYNYVCSGAEEMCRRYPWIDKERIGIDGQSWGGYQTAFLVTRTNMFACAGSGAPVSNMTSAYGGIRWESGDSRQAQYEQGQSRIGGTLWDKTAEYIANSPVFHADKVNTPLLIMHNDNDGAVPWYQGIEMFMALRRLQKPVWMLQYNGESHNIKDRKNRKDITKRLQQFFDHYLKGDPMPKWMKEGVPMIRKGQEFGFELETK